MSRIKAERHPGPGRTGLILRYWRNRRLDEYGQIIRLAADRDYCMISLRDFARQQYPPQRPLLVLRHDVDHVSKATLAMHRIEQKYGARSSFYFRRSTFDLPLMQEIERSGSEASFHYETLADYMKAEGIESREALYVRDFREACIQRLETDLHFLRDEWGLECTTLASHGEAINRLTGVSNNILFEDPFLSQRLGVLLEAYNEAFIQSVSCYISDTVQERNGGYRYGIHPREAIARHEPLILFLTHPNHWHYSLVAILRKTVRLIVQRPVVQAETFRRI